MILVHTASSTLGKNLVFVLKHRGSHRKSCFNMSERYLCVESFTANVGEGTFIGCLGRLHHKECDKVIGRG